MFLWLETFATVVTKGAVTVRYCSYTNAPEVFRPLGIFYPVMCLCVRARV